MLKTILLAAAVAAILPQPALAEPGPVRTVRVDGRVLRYTADHRPDGSTVIESTDCSPPFRLLVRDGRVTGLFGYQPVDFAAPRVRPVRIAAR